MRTAVRLLSEHAIDDASTEARLLLGHALGLNATDIYINIDRELSADKISLFDSLIHRRINHEPSAYIIGHKEFYGLDFYVNRHVLIPRPETELLVEKAISLATAYLPADSFIADIGTGCGAIAVALALNLSESRIYATDISIDALEIARQNCLKHGVNQRTILLSGSLLDPLPHPVHLILANLPYIGEGDMLKLPPEISDFEPEIALGGGAGGLEVITKLLSQSASKLLKGGIIMLEIGYNQGPGVAKLASSYFPRSQIRVDTDLNGMDRLLTIAT